MRRQKRDSLHRAYVKGYQAGCNGRNRSHCPHSQGTILAAEWLNGWKEGREDNWRGFNTQAMQQKALNI